MQWHQVKGGFTDLDTQQPIDKIYVYAETPQEASSIIAANPKPHIEKITLKNEGKPEITYYLSGGTPDQRMRSAKTSYWLDTLPGPYSVPIDFDYLTNQ